MVYFLSANPCWTGHVWCYDLFYSQVPRDRNKNRGRCIDHWERTWSSYGRMPKGDWRHRKTHEQHRNRETLDNLKKLALSNWDKLGYSTHKFLLLVKPLLKIAPKCLWFRSCCLLVDFFANVSRFSIFTVLAISSEDLACFSLFVNFFSAEAWQRENKATKVRRWCEDIWKVRRSAIFAHEVMVRENRTMCFAMLLL